MIGLWLGDRQSSSPILSVSVVIYVVVFAVGLGGSLNAYLSETLPPLGYGLSLSMQWIVTALVGQFLPNLMESFGPTTLMICFAVIGISLFFILDYLIIETKSLFQDPSNRNFFALST